MCLLVGWIARKVEDLGQRSLPDFGAFQPA